MDNFKKIESQKQIKCDGTPKSIQKVLKTHITSSLFIKNHNDNINKNNEEEEPTKEQTKTKNNKRRNASIEIMTKEQIRLEKLKEIESIYDDYQNQTLTDNELKNELERHLKKFIIEPSKLNR